LILSTYSPGPAEIIAFPGSQSGADAATAALSPRRPCARSLWRRVLIHRSTFADLAYCVIGLATLGAIIGWAVVSTSWISDGVGALPVGSAWAPTRTRPTSSSTQRILALFFAYRLFH
jgi:hypothetical protein